MTDGAKAARAGRRLEEFVGDVLDELGYEQVPPDRFLSYLDLQQPLWSAQFSTGLNIYGKQRRVDVILYHPTKWPNCLVVQCKWQAVPGSVEEKYPFEVINIEQDKYPAIIVLDGGGYTNGAELWLRRQAGMGKNLRHVLDQGGLQRLASRGLV